MEQVNNNQKVTNKFYVAVYILLFVFATIFVIGSIALIAISYSDVFMNEFYDELVEQGYDSAMANSQLLTVQQAFRIYGFLMTVGAIVMYIEAVFFIKYSRLTNSEAEQYYGRCLAWVIVSYFFGGLIVGGLATAGLCVTQNAQRKQLEESTPWQTSDGKQVNVSNTSFVSDEDKYSAENIEKMKIRLQKLKELKDTNIISEDEFNTLRSKVMGYKVEEKKAEAIDNNPNELNASKLEKISQRLAKIKELKEMGALSETEYEKLRDKIIDEDK